MEAAAAAAANITTVEPLRYERAIPGAFQFPATSDASGASKFFTYSIIFSHFQAGTDPLQHLASDFILLAPLLLDEEISGMSVNLHLPNCASVQAHITYCGPALLDSDKVQTMKLFTAWIFHFLTGKSIQQQPRSSEKSGKQHGPKYYYILPLLSDGQQMTSPETISAKLIDWSVVRASLGSSLVYKRKSDYADLLAELKDAYAGFNEGSSSYLSVEEGKLRMLNGTFSMHELEDAVVSCTNNGSSYYIHGALQRFPDNSLVQPSLSRLPLTYTEYFAKKWKYNLLFPNQPLLKGYRLLQAGNYLRKTSFSSSNGKDLLLKGWETMELPGEVCTLHMGMHGKLFRGAMRLPSVLHSLEMTLVAADLRNTIGLPLSCFKMQEALTATACESHISYETLELLGDSILNFAGGTCVFMEHLFFNREQLHIARHELVCNKALHQFALLCGLTPYIFAELWNPRVWVPPGPAMGNHLSQEGLEGQVLGWKTLADVVEAIVGVYLMNGSLEASMKAMAWLGLPMYLPSKFPEAPVLERLSDMNLLGTADIDSLQNKLGYQFNDSKLLVSAFDAFGHDEDRMEQKEGCEFQRLSFLGNSILDFLISRHLVLLYPQLDPASLTDLKHATVNIENFASIALRRGLHVYLQKVSPELTCQIRQFAICFWQEGGSAFGIREQSSPWALGALIQTIAGAIFLDSNLDNELVWKILEPLLQPIATPETVMLHPLRQLEILCQKQGRKLDIQSEQSNGVVQAHVFIDCILLGTSQNKERNVARRLAACKALRSISHQAFGFHHPDMKNDPVIRGKAESTCSSNAVENCNMGIATSYHYLLSGQGMWQRISTLGHLFVFILKLLFERPQMTAGMCPSISVMPALELDSRVSNGV